MATIVKHKSSGDTYVLLGTGLGAIAGGRVEWLYGALDSEDDSTIFSVVAVSTPSGEIRWIPSEELSVETIDGRTPADLLAEAHARA